MGKTIVDTPCRGEVGDYVTINDIRLPGYARVSWEPHDEEPFTYWEGRITDVEIDPAA